LTLLLAFIASFGIIVGIHRSLWHYFIRALPVNPRISAFLANGNIVYEVYRFVQTEIK